MNWLKHFFDVRHMLPGTDADALQSLPASRSMYRTYIQIAIPSVAEMVLISLINMMDTVMVSSIDTAAVAAVGLVQQPRMIMLCLFFALNTGITALVARRRGENRPDEANAAVRTSIVMMMVISAVLMAVLLPLSRPLMKFAGAVPGETLEDSTEYFMILGYALPFQALSMGLCAAQRGVGNTRLTMRVNLTSNVVNVIFNYLLINGVEGFIPRMGVRGAAIATDIGLVVGFFLSVLAMRKKKDSFLYLSLKEKWTTSREAYGILTRMGASAMVEQLAMRVGFFSYARIIAGLGTDAFAAHQITGQFMGLSFSFADGLGIAGTSLVGQKLGEKRTDLAHIFGTLAQRFSLVIGLGLASLCILLRAPLVGMFVSNDPTGEVRAMAETIMIILGVIQPLQMLSVVISGALRGAGDVRYTARVSLITIAMIRPILAFLGTYIGFNLLNNAPLALTLAWCATLCDMTVRLILYIRRYKNGKWHEIKV